MAKRKRQPAAAAGPPPGSGQTADQIIKCLEQASSLTGQRPHRVFDNWLQLVEVTLEMLPAHLRAIARTGQLAPDSPEAAATFARLRGEQRGRDRAAVRVLFGHYARAFGYLLDGTAPGLWSPAAAEGYLGPDILGQTYMRYANTDPRWQAQYFTPWAVALTLAKLTVPNGPAEVHARLKQALTHPDNLLGPAVLLTGLAIDDPQEAYQWFLSHVVPAAMPFVEPLKITDPACGSGVLLLAAASQFEPWMVQSGLVQVFGQDLDETCVRMARISCKLYGLNGFAVKLAQAMAEVAALDTPLLTAGQALITAHRLFANERPVTRSRSGAPTFEELFKKSVETSTV